MEALLRYANLMEKVLFINACVRRDSRTKRLAEAYLERYESSQIKEVKLDLEDIRPLDERALNHRDSLKELGDFSDPFFRYARDFKAADIVVIAAPYWDLSFPSSLKVYVENICCSGLTFQYVDGEYISLCRVRRVVYLATAGSGIIGNLGFEYIKTLFSAFFGVKDYSFVSAEGLDAEAADIEALMEDALSRVKKLD